MTELSRMAEVLFADVGPRLATDCHDWTCRSHADDTENYLREFRLNVLPLSAFSSPPADVCLDFQSLLQ